MPRLVVSLLKIHHTMQMYYSCALLGYFINDTDNITATVTNNAVLHCPVM